MVLIMQIFKPTHPSNQTEWSCTYLLHANVNIPIPFHILISFLFNATGRGKPNQQYQKTKICTILSTIFTATLESFLLGADSVPWFNMLLHLSHYMNEDIVSKDGSYQKPRETEMAVESFC